MPTTSRHNKGGAYKNSAQVANYFKGHARPSKWNIIVWGQLKHCKVKTKTRKKKQSQLISTYRNSPYILHIDTDRLAVLMLAICHPSTTSKCKRQVSSPWWWCKTVHPILDHSSKAGGREPYIPINQIAFHSALKKKKAS